MSAGIDPALEANDLLQPAHLNLIDGVKEKMSLPMSQKWVLVVSIIWPEFA